MAKWGYQMTPWDSWDYDGVNESILADLTIDGKPVKALVRFDRNGFTYITAEEEVCAYGAPRPHDMGAGKRGGRFDKAMKSPKVTQSFGAPWWNIYTGRLKGENQYNE
jgi:hypothetical protein